MLTIKAMTGGGGIAAYLSNADYYAEGETITGQWMGHGAEKLGLKGAVKIEDLESILMGNDPTTGEYLKTRHNSDSVVERVTKDGKTIIDERKVRNMYDCTFSAPKALSILWLKDPETAMAAHNAGVAAGAEVMERMAGARIRKNNANDTRITSNLVIARFDHLASRAVDINLHSHLAAANVTFDAVVDDWRALDAREMYQQTRYSTAAYRNASAAILHERGYQTYARFTKGKYNGYGIVGIEESTLEKFSRRTKEKEAAVQEFIQQNGRQPSKSEIALLVRETRDQKPAITTAEVIARQLERLSPQEEKSLTNIQRMAQEGGSIRENSGAVPSLEFAAEHIFERVSTTKDWELKTEALNHGCGKIDLAELNGRLAAKIVGGEMLAGHGEVATEATLKRERLMVATVNEGIGKFEPLGRGREIQPSPKLKEQQREAVLAALASRDLVFEISGAAGVGKTTLLNEIQRGLNEARRSVVAVATSTSAVEELQKEGFPQATTIAELRVSPQKQADLRGQVLVIDEAGMVGTGDMSELLKLAKAQDARILTVGDSRQIRSVDAGDALRILEKHSDMNRISVTEVQRQTNAELKKAVMTLRRKPAEGYELLQKMGAIHEVHWRERALEVTKAYRRESLALNAKGQQRSVLVMASTHEEIRNITHAIRSELKRDGKLADGQEFTKHTALNWTEAQKKQTKNYQPGQILEFHKAVKGIARKNEALEVISANKTSVTARRNNGEAVQIVGKHGKAFGVFEKDTVEVAAGDKLLLQSNWKTKEFKATNGELVTVSGIEAGKIRLQDGRELPNNYRQFSSGYVITSHKSQAKTVDAGIVAAERMPRDQFYVAVTRSRESVTVITSDSVGLAESIGASADRQSAIELAERAAHIAARAHRFEHEDYQVYQKFQQHQRPVLRTEIQQEMNRNASTHRIGY